MRAAILDGEPACHRRDGTAQTLTRRSVSVLTPGAGTSSRRQTCVQPARRLLLPFTRPPFAASFNAVNFTAFHLPALFSTRGIHDDRTQTRRPALEPARDSRRHGLSRRHRSGPIPIPDVAGQTGQILDKIDQYLKEAGTDKSKILTATIWALGYTLLRRDELGVGQVGRSGQRPCACVRRGQARPYQIPGRDPRRRCEIAKRCW